jgi:hypothetical protein
MNTFFNWSDEDFTYSWGGKPYTFPAGSVTEDVAKSVHGNLLLEEGIARHFAKHLADRELQKAGINPGRLDIHEEYTIRAMSLPQPAAEKEKEVKEEKKPAKKAAKKTTKKVKKDEII